MQTVLDFAPPWRAWRPYFDPPMARQYLAGLTGIEVKFNPGERADAPPAAALLIASWLMECTGMDIACMGVRRAEVSH